MEDEICSICKNPTQPDKYGSCYNLLFGMTKLTINKYLCEYNHVDVPQMREYTPICSHCLNKLKRHRDEYINEIQSIVDKFNQDILNVTKLFVHAHIPEYKDNFKPKI